MISQMGTTNYQSFLAAMSKALKTPWGLANNENPCDSDAEQPPADGTTVALGHGFFRVFPNAHFQRSGRNDEPVFVIEVMASELQLPISAIMREFDIPKDSPDGRMLETIRESLNFVTFLRLGDPIPAEVLTDEPGQYISESDQDLAYQRLLLILRASANGEPASISKIDELRKSTNEATEFGDFEKVFFEALDELGCGNGTADSVVGSLQSMANDLVRIEKLRGRFREIQAIQDQIHRLLLRMGHDADARDFVATVAGHMSEAVKAYQGTLRRVEIEMQGAIADFAPNAERAKTTQPRISDDLYRRFLAWDALVNEWGHVKSKPGPQAETLVWRTYSFLAQRFLEPSEAMSLTGETEADARMERDVVAAA